MTENDAGANSVSTLNAEASSTMAPDDDRSEARRGLATVDSYSSLGGASPNRRRPEETSSGSPISRDRSLEAGPRPLQPITVPPPREEGVEFEHIDTILDAPVLPPQRTQRARVVKEAAAGDEASPRPPPLPSWGTTSPPTRPIHNQGENQSHPQHRHQPSSVQVVGHIDRERPSIQADGELPEDAARGDVPLDLRNALVGNLLNGHPLLTVFRTAGSREELFRRHIVTMKYLNPLVEDAYLVMSSRHRLGVTVIAAAAAIIYLAITLTNGYVGHWFGTLNFVVTAICILISVANLILCVIQTPTTYLEQIRLVQINEVLAHALFIAATAVAIVSYSAILLCFENETDNGVAEAYTVCIKGIDGNVVLIQFIPLLFVEFLRTSFATAVVLLVIAVQYGVGRAIAPSQPDTSLELTTKIIIHTFCAVSIALGLRFNEKQRREKFETQLTLCKGDRMLALRQRQVDQSLKLLLPHPVVVRLLRGEAPIDSSQQCTIVTAKLYDFPRWSCTVLPPVLVYVIDALFCTFDAAITEKFRLFKIKAVADMYMCAAGLQDDMEEKEETASSGLNPLTNVNAGSPFRLETKSAVFRALYFSTFQHRALARLQGLTRLSGLTLCVGCDTSPCVGFLAMSSSLSYEVVGNASRVASEFANAGHSGVTLCSRYTMALVEMEDEEAGRVFNFEPGPFIAMGGQRGLNFEEVPTFIVTPQGRSPRSSAMNPRAFNERVAARPTFEHAPSARSQSGSGPDNSSSTVAAPRLLDAAFPGEAALEPSGQFESFAMSENPEDDVELNEDRRKVVKQLWRHRKLFAARTEMLVSPPPAAGTEGAPSGPSAEAPLVLAKNSDTVNVSKPGKQNSASHSEEQNNSSVFSWNVSSPNTGSDERGNGEGAAGGSGEDDLRRQSTASRRRSSLAFTMGLPVSEISRLREVLLLANPTNRFVSLTFEDETLEEEFQRRQREHMHARMVRSVWWHLVIFPLFPLLGVGIDGSITPLGAGLLLAASVIAFAFLFWQRYAKAAKKMPTIIDTAYSVGIYLLIGAGIALCRGSVLLASPSWIFYCFSGHLLLSSQRVSWILALLVEAILLLQIYLLSLVGNNRLLFSDYLNYPIVAFFTTFTAYWLDVHKRELFRDRLLLELTIVATKEEVALQRMLLELVIPQAVVGIVAEKVEGTRGAIVESIGDVCVAVWQFEGYRMLGTSAAQLMNSSTALQNASSSTISMNHGLSVGSAGGYAFQMKRLEALFQFLDAVCQQFAGGLIDKMYSVGDRVTLAGPIMEHPKLKLVAAAQNMAIGRDRGPQGVANAADGNRHRRHGRAKGPPAAGLGEEADVNQAPINKRIVEEDLSLKAAKAMLSILAAVEGEFRVTEPSEVTTSSVRANTQMDAGNTNTDVLTGSGAAWSVVVHCGAGFAAVVGSHRPVFTILGPVTRIADALLDASPTGTKIVSTAFRRFLSVGYQDAPWKIETSFKRPRKYPPGAAMESTSSPSVRVGGALGMHSVSTLRSSADGPSSGTFDRSLPLSDLQGVSPLQSVSMSYLQMEEKEVKCVIHLGEALRWRVRGAGVQWVSPLVFEPVRRPHVPSLFETVTPMQRTETDVPDGDPVPIWAGPSIPSFSFMAP